MLAGVVLRGPLRSRDVIGSLVFNLHPYHSTSVAYLDIAAYPYLYISFLCSDVSCADSNLSSTAFVMHVQLSMQDHTEAFWHSGKQSW